MIASIDLMQLQIRQLILTKINYCDQELDRMTDNADPNKRRVVALKREQYKRDLKSHMFTTTNKVNRNKNKTLDKQEALLKFLDVSY